MRKETKDTDNRNIDILYYSAAGDHEEVVVSKAYNCTSHFLPRGLTQEAYLELLDSCGGDTVLLVDRDRMPLGDVTHLLNCYFERKDKDAVGYVSHKDVRLWDGAIQRSFATTDKHITVSPVFVGRKSVFQKSYVGNDLADNLLIAVGYSLQKSFARFTRLAIQLPEAKDSPSLNTKGLLCNYLFKAPLQYLFSGDFFRNIFRPADCVRRDMVFRMLMVVFALFTFFYMPYISRDYGISGDEFVDQRHAGYVIDYFVRGDSAALYQPKTALHLYGNGVQVIAEAICRTFHVEDIYAVRHAFNGLIGALGVLMTGLLALRWGGGLCGLLAMLMMFFTPRYFGHSMNNMKDAPFAVGYVMSIYYFIRLFDHYPYFKPRYMIGAMIGIFLTLGTRSGGLLLFPYLLMYGGLFYILRVGVREFYKIGRYKDDILRIIWVIFVVLVIGYILSILLWPYALQKPATGVIVSLKQFTNYNIGLRTIFDGKQVMSTMLPWNYAPQYFLIGMPLVIVAGFLGYIVYLIFRRKEFSLISFFLLFVAIFPVFWVIYKHSNLYGGIRHLLFVMPIMAVIAARFWVLLMACVSKVVRIVVIILFAAGLSLPAIHMVKNHPNDYVYFNEVVGGLEGAYGDYETDYYYNSLKNACDWFRKNIQLPKDKETIIVTNHTGILEHYFRHDKQVKIIYSRYYEKYSKDWDYAIFANVYINSFQLKNGLFPSEGTIYSTDVDGRPMSVVIKRQIKDELEGFRLEREKEYGKALQVFEEYISRYTPSEEVYARMAKLYYAIDSIPQAIEYGLKSVKLHPTLNEALSVLSFSYLKQQKYDEALAAAQSILDENELSADGYYLKALAYSEMGRYQDALNHINTTLSYRPQHEGALTLAGEILLENGNYKVAAEIYQRLFNIRKSVNDLVALADCYCRMQQYDQADKLLTEIQKAQPGFLPVYKVWLRMMIQRKDMVNAKQLLAQMESVTNDSELYVLRALYHLLSNSTGTAMAELDRALELDGKNVEALKLKAQLAKNITVTK